MKAIHKYTLPSYGSQTFKIAPGFKVLSLQEQRGSPVMWVLEDTSLPTEEINIRVLTTGSSCNLDPERYLGTIQLEAHNYVVHYFEETP